MLTFHALTTAAELELRIFRDRNEQAQAEQSGVALDLGLDAQGFHSFRSELDHQVHEAAHVELRQPSGEPLEGPELVRTVPRTPGHFFPDELWLIEGVKRVLESDPLADALPAVRIHLLLPGNYRGGHLYVWSPGHPERRLPESGSDHDGPYFDVPLGGRDQSLFCFKFTCRSGDVTRAYFALNSCGRMGHSRAMPPTGCGSPPTAQRSGRSPA